jgi:hypothetical protein
MSGNESFDKIAGELGSTFDPQKEFDKQTDKITKVKNKLVCKDAENLTLEDVEYMELELKEVLMGLQRVMDTLEQEIKIGAKAIMFEVYSTLTNSKINAVRELRELRKIIVDIKFKNKKSEDKEKSPNNVTMVFNSISDVLEASKNARKNSSLNSIDADFKIEE